MSAVDDIMAEGGYVKASRAATAIGASNVGSLHRMVRTGKLEGIQWAGRYWYISVQSLLDAYEKVPPILERVRGLGVKPASPKKALPPLKKKK